MAEGQEMTPAEGATAQGKVFLSPADLAQRWGVSLEAIRALRKRGKLPPAQPLPLRVVRWHFEEIERYEAELRGKIHRRRPMAVKSGQAPFHAGG